MLYKDKHGRVYDGLWNRLRGSYSPPLTLRYCYMDKWRFSISEAEWVMVINFAEGFRNGHQPAIDLMDKIRGCS